jgi:hypothetical protein
VRAVAALKNKPTPYSARELFDGKWMLLDHDVELGKFASLAECKAAIKRMIEKKIVHFDKFGEEVK